jgi:hypothetical protein
MRQITLANGSVVDIVEHDSNDEDGGGEELNGHAEEEKQSDAYDVDFDAALCVIDPVPTALSTRDQRLDFIRACYRSWRVHCRFGFRSKHLELLYMSLYQVRSGKM